MAVRLGNLCIIGNPLGLSSGLFGREAGWAMGSWRLHGAHTYYLVETRGQAVSRQHLIIEPPERTGLDLELLHRDMLALQFIWGEVIECPLLYGVRGSEITACMGTRYIKSSPGLRAPAIDDHLEHFEYWIEPFFSKLSQALRAETTTRLGVPVEVSFASRHPVIDVEAHELRAALMSLSHWTLRGAADTVGLVRQPEVWEAWTRRLADELRAVAEPTLLEELIKNIKMAACWTPQQRFERALVRLGIHLPREVLDELAFYEGRLSSIGSLTESIDRSTEEIEREVRLIDTLRTLLVAMVAASVGYHGVIRGVGHDEGPPAWWHVEPDEEEGIYRCHVAVTAPAPASVPRLAPGEVLLLVEQRHHRTIVQEILRAAGLPVSRVRILHGDGREGLRELAQAAESSPMAILAGGDQLRISGAIEELRRELGLGEHTNVFCAVPDVDAWLLADDDLLHRHFAGDPELLVEIEAMPLPEELSDPFERVHRLLGPPETWSIAREMNIEHACARSPSLRDFLFGMAKILGVEIHQSARNVPHAGIDALRGQGRRKSS